MDTHTPIAPTAAERQASANLAANRAALAITQSGFSQRLLPPHNDVEWVFARDGMLTALDEQGNWWSGCSVPRAAAAAMLKRMDVNAPVACFLAPPHAAPLRIALDKLLPEQAIIAVVPQASDVSLLLACEDFSRDLEAHRLWLAAGANWPESLERTLTEEIGLAVPAQFLRLHSSDETLIQQLVSEATSVFSRITMLRSKMIGELSQAQSRAEEKARKFCIIAARQFRLWENEGRILAKLAPADSIQIDTSDPASSSTLRLATTARDCGALLAPNLARADAPGTLPTDLPWFTWVTNDRIPSFNLAGPHDKLLIADDLVRASALAADWPADRVLAAGWPAVALPAPNGKRAFTVLADTIALNTPADLEEFSSHRVLWETIQHELSKNPFALDNNPADYLAKQLRRFDVSGEAFPHDRFLIQLIIPAFQQGIVRLLVRAGLSVELHGQGWSDIDEFKSRSLGVIDSDRAMEAAIGNAAALVDLWPWRAAHPVRAATRPVLNCKERNVDIFIPKAKRLFACGDAKAPVAIKPLCRQLLSDLLQTNA